VLVNILYRLNTNTWNNRIVNSLKQRSKRLIPTMKTLKLLHRMRNLTTWITKTTRKEEDKITKNSNLLRTMQMVQIRMITLNKKLIQKEFTGSRNLKMKKKMLKTQKKEMITPPKKRRRKQHLLSTCHTSQEENGEASMRSTKPQNGDTLADHLLL